MKKKTYIGWRVSPGHWFPLCFVRMLTEYNSTFKVRDVTHLNKEERFVLLFEVLGADMHSANTAIMKVSNLMEVSPYKNAVSTNTVSLSKEE